MDSGIFFEFDASHYPEVVLFAFETRSLQQRRLCDNYNRGTATSDYGLKV